MLERLHEELTRLSGIVKLIRYCHCIMYDEKLAAPVLCTREGFCSKLYYAVAQDKEILVLLML